MKAIQTIYNAKDFQSSVITTIKTWTEIRRFVHNAISWEKLYDKDLFIHRTPLANGLFMPYIKNGWVLQDDDTHIMITYLNVDNLQETWMLYLVEDEV